MTNIKPGPSEFKNLRGIEYFQFEEDFMEENIRCIPMIVRLKMDETGIKLKLSEWSKFHPDERIQLALLPVSNETESRNYRQFLINLIRKYTKNEATELAIDPMPAWKNLSSIPAILHEQSAALALSLSIRQWQNLSDTQRFALLKLCRPGHENKNFPKAVAEFGLLGD